VCDFFFTSAKEVMFSFAFFCLSDSRITQNVFGEFCIKFFLAWVGCVTIATNDWIWVLCGITIRIQECFEGIFTTANKDNYNSNIG